MIKLSDHFTYKKLIRFTLPSVAMMIFMSVYGVVDGFFVSNFVGKTPFAAVNFIYPFIMILSGVGFMFGTGGSALIAKTLGEEDRAKANKLFSMLIYLTLGVSISVGAAGFFAVRPVASLLGAEGEMLENCVTYGRILMLDFRPYVLFAHSGVSGGGGAFASPFLRYGRYLVVCGGRRACRRIPFGCVHSSKKEKV